MNFKWQDYIQLAEDLNKEANNSSLSEANYRASISRTYYGCFCTARNFLVKERNQTISRSGRAHQEVKNKFKESSNYNDRQVGVNLERLRIDRNKADYDDRFNNIRRQSDLDLLLAKEILGFLEEL